MGAGVLAGADAESIWLGTSGAITVRENPSHTTWGTTALTRRVVATAAKVWLEELSLPGSVPTARPAPGCWPRRPTSP